jgi:hypothetical protein
MRGCIPPASQKPRTATQGEAWAGHVQLMKGSRMVAGSPRHGRGYKRTAGTGAGCCAAADCPKKAGVGCWVLGVWGGEAKRSVSIQPGRQANGC